MKKLMLILLILVIAHSIYSESVSSWWESKTREERIEILTEYIKIKNAELLIDDIEYICEFKDGKVNFYSKDKTYIASIDSLTYEIELPAFVFDVPQKFPTEAIIGSSVAFILGLLIGCFSN